MDASPPDPAGQNSSANPYQSPESRSPHLPQTRPRELATIERPDQLLDPGGIFLRWEQHRLVYNAILAITTFLVASINVLIGVGEFARLVLLVFSLPKLALIANVCFSAGAPIELGLYRCRFWLPAFMPVLFWMGTALSMLLALAATVLITTVPLF